MSETPGAVNAYITANSRDEALYQAQWIGHQWFGHNNLVVEIKRAQIYNGEKAIVVTALQFEAEVTITELDTEHVVENIDEWLDTIVTLDEGGVTPEQISRVGAAIKDGTLIIETD